MNYNMKSKKDQASRDDCRQSLIYTVNKSQ